jgi:hypothetical protein
VGLLTLYSGLLLPWLGGVLWLTFADSRFYSGHPVNRFRQAGYGFFLGYAVLFLALMSGNKLTGAVSWPGLMAFLLVFTASGAVAAWLSRTHPVTKSGTPQVVLSIPVKILIAVMMILMVIHLVFITMEIFTQPVYPWDAWLAWVYRAKAWFMGGTMADVVSRSDWATATSSSTYTIDAWRYPLFPSVMPYWAALSLGRWSETLVNLPVLFAGSAIGMAVYGQCREHGLNIIVSLVTCYLLFSIPLFATHLALAGYADIWMAGFAGLGFLALIRGAILRKTSDGSGFQIVLGLMMIFFSIWVKNEGAVWFLAALAMLILATSRPRVPILMMVMAVIVALIAFALGITHIELPLLGRFGVIDGRLVIPFIGSFALEAHNVQHVYWDNFIKMGSWNLLWLLVAASLVLGFRSPNHVSGYRARRSALSFLLVFLATQLFIFGFTDQGLWADTYTAINRLPLHFLPALLFALVIIGHASLAPEEASGSDVAQAKLSTGSQRPRPASRSFPDLTSSHLLPREFSILIISTLLAAAIVTAGTLTSLSKDLPTRGAQAIHTAAKDLKFAFGSGHPEASRMLVNEFANGYALLTSGPVSVQANTHRALSYTWLPPKMPQEAAFFWRRSGDAQNVLKTEITAAGSHMIDLATEPDWKGEITEFGFLLAGSNGEVVELGDTMLIPDGLNTRLQLTWHAWTAFEEWSQQSINFIHGGDHRQVFALPLLVAAWLLLTLLLLWMFSRFGKRTVAPQLLIIAGILFITAWTLLDIRWSANNLRQIQLSFKTQWQVEDQQRSSIDLDGEIYQYTQRLKTSVLGGQNARILILGDETAIDYYLLRAKYHLLPHSVNVAGSLARELTPASLDFVIFFGEPTGLVKVRGWSPAWRQSLIQVDSGEWGAVYRVAR